jgi:hypothetical protein
MTVTEWSLHLRINLAAVMPAMPLPKMMMCMSFSGCFEQQRNVLFHTGVVSAATIWNQKRLRGSPLAVSIKTIAV